MSDAYLNWKLEDYKALQESEAHFTPLDPDDRLIFLVNPNQMDSPIQEQGVTLHAASANGAYRGFRLDQPRTWTFSGVLYSAQEYEGFQDWVRERDVSVLTDHLDRRFVVRLTGFTPVRAPWRNYPWRHTYSCAVTTYMHYHLNRSYYGGR